MTKDKKLRAVADAALTLARAKITQPDFIGALQQLASIERPVADAGQPRTPMLVRATTASRRKPRSVAQPLAVPAVPTPTAVEAAAPVTAPAPRETPAAARQPAPKKAITAKAPVRQPRAAAAEPAPAPKPAPPPVEAPIVASVQLMKRKDVEKTAARGRDLDIRTSGLTPEEARAQAERLFR